GHMGAERGHLSADAADVVGVGRGAVEPHRLRQGDQETRRQGDRCGGIGARPGRTCPLAGARRATCCTMKIADIRHMEQPRFVMDRPGPCFSYLLVSLSACLPLSRSPGHFGTVRTVISGKPWAARALRTASSLKALRSFRSKRTSRLSVSV